MIQRIKQYNQFHVTKARNAHIQRVVEMALQLAHVYKLSEVETKQLELAAYLHDSTKDFSDRQLEMLLYAEKQDLLDFPQPIWHSFASAFLARDYFQIDDQSIFEAIFFHTIGSVKLDRVGKLLFLADFIEIERTFPEATKAREKALNGHLNEALYITLKSMITFLAQSDKKPTAETLAFYVDIERSI